MGYFKQAQKSLHEVSSHLLGKYMMIGTASLYANAAIMKVVNKQHVHSETTGQKNSLFQWQLRSIAYCLAVHCKAFENLFHC